MESSYRPRLAWSNVISGPPTPTVLCSAAARSDLRLIATNGTTVGGPRLTTIRPGVCINNRGTLAFAAFTSVGRSTMFAVTLDGTAKNFATATRTSKAMAPQSTTT